MVQEVALIMVMEEIMVVTILVSTPHHPLQLELLMPRHPPMEEPQSTCPHPQDIIHPSNQTTICIPQDPPITKQQPQQISMLSTQYMSVPPPSVQHIVNSAMGWVLRTATQPTIQEVLVTEEESQQERIQVLIMCQHQHLKGLPCSSNALILNSITKTWWITTLCMSTQLVSPHHPQHLGWPLNHLLLPLPPLHYIQILQLQRLDH